MTSTIPGTDIAAAELGRTAQQSRRGRRLANEGQPRRPGVRAGKPTLRGAAASSLLWLYALVSVAPLILMVSNSLRTTQQMAANPLGLPVTPNFSSYQKAWVTASFETYFVNSIMVTVLSVALSTAVSLLAAYAFARSKS